VNKLGSEPLMKYQTHERIAIPHNIELHLKGIEFQEKACIKSQKRGMWLHCFAGESLDRVPATR
jgi:hypothetical protein